MTHYIPTFTRRNGHKQEAVCGAWVASAAHSSEPSCERCATYLQGKPARDAEDEETASALAAEFPEMAFKLKGGNHGKA